MKRASRLVWLIAAAVGVIISAGSSAAQAPKQLHEKHDTAALHGSLGDVIRLGVKLFNDQSDYAGCYRVFQGSLLSVRPFLAGDLQKKIDKGLASAEKEPTYADRALALRAVLDDIRGQLKPTEAKVGENKEEKKTEKKQEEKKSEEKKTEKKVEEKKSTATDVGKGQLAGRVTFDGQPLAAGYSITLVRDGKRFSTALQKDGIFQFTMPIAPGEYAIAIENAAKTAELPPRYAREKTSGLSITVRSGKQQVDLNLVK